MNYDDTKRLLEIQEENAKRFAQMADDLSFIRDRLSSPDDVSKNYEEDEIVEVVEDDRPRRREEKVTIFNDDQSFSDTVMDNKFSTESSFTSKDNTVKTDEYSAADVMEMINVLLYIAIERQQTFGLLLKNQFGIDFNSDKYKQKKLVEFIYDIVHTKKIEEIDKALKTQTLNGDNMYKIYKSFK